MTGPRESVDTHNVTVMSLLQGEVAGEFVPHKMSIKYGCLDFVYTLSPDKARKHVLKIQDPQVNVDIALTPDEGGQHCQLTTPLVEPLIKNTVNMGY